MIIKTVWVKRSGSEDEPPELLVAIDQMTLDVHDEDYINVQIEQALASWKNPDISQQVTIDISVPMNEIDKAFLNKTIKGTVTSHSQ